MMTTIRIPDPSASQRKIRSPGRTFDPFEGSVEIGVGSPKDTALLDRYHQSRDALHLELQDEQSRTIKTSAIHIVDYSQFGGPATIELDVLISDEGYWRRRATGG